MVAAIALTEENVIGICRISTRKTFTRDIGRNSLPAMGRVCQSYDSKCGRSICWQALVVIVVLLILGSNPVP